MAEGLEVAVRQAGVSVCPPATTFGPRTLSDYELVSFVEGSAEGDCSGSPQHARRGSVMLLRPQMTDSWRFAADQATLIAYIHFDIVKMGSQLPPSDQWPVVRQMRRGNIVQPVCWYVARLANIRPRGWEEVARHAVALLLAAFVQGATDEDVSGPATLPPAVEHVLKHIRSLIWGSAGFENPKLAELSAVASVSPSHLSHLFKEAVGCGPMQALRLLRLEQAGRMLAHTNLSVRGVAQATGFANEFHFSRRFKDLYGISPRAFRQQMAAEGTMPPIPSPHTRELLSRLLTAEDPGDLGSSPVL